jgi:hypothetical protein
VLYLRSSRCWTLCITVKPSGEKKLGQLEEERDRKSQMISQSGEEKILHTPYGVSVARTLYRISGGGGREVRTVRCQLFVAEFSEGLDRCTEYGVQL